MENIALMSRRQFFESKGYEWEWVQRILDIHRIYKWAVNNVIDTHHLVARIRWGNNNGNNLKKMRRGDHSTHHEAYGVKLPHEQLISNIDLNRRAYQNEVINRIHGILDEAEDRNKLYKK